MQLLFATIIIRQHTIFLQGKNGNPGLPGTAGPIGPSVSVT